MSEQLNRLAIWAKYLINASYDYREHCCEFSKFLVQNVPDDYWPDVAAQLISMLDDIDSMNKECAKLLEPLKADIVKAVAQLNLPKPDGHLSWTSWIVDHWMHLSWKVKLGLQAHLSAVPSDPDQWFHQMSIQVRREPEKCKELSRHLFSLAECFVDFEEKERLINLVRAECLGVHMLANQATPRELTSPTAPIYETKPLVPSVFEDSAALPLTEVLPPSEPPEDPEPIDYPIRWRTIFKRCVNKKNRAGEVFATSNSTIYGWKYIEGWPKPMTWNTVRAFINTFRDFDIGEPHKDL